MSNRTSMFALAAIATIATATLTPTSAFAFGHSGGGHFGGSHVSGHGFGRSGHFGFNYHHGHYHWPIWSHDHDRWPSWWAKYRHPYYYGVDRDGGAAGRVATDEQPTGSGNCLTKQYVPGGVLFEDLCTKEEAIATPNQMQPQSQAAPRAR